VFLESLAPTLLILSSEPRMMRVVAVITSQANDLRWRQADEKGREPLLFKHNSTGWLEAVKYLAS
jgi:hypothetical protein